MFESFIVKHSKAKRAKDSHLCQKRVSNTRRGLQETYSAKLGFDHWEVLELRQSKRKQPSKLQVESSFLLNIS